MAKHQKNKFCSDCGKAVSAGDHFCASCGNKISNKPNKTIKARKQQNWLWITASAVAMAFLISIVVFNLKSNEKKSVNRAHNTSQIASIASEFDCSCGSCDKVLRDCDCPTAQDTLAYISQKVGKEKYSRLEIIKMVNERFGYLINKSILQG